jgi:ADP-heptose:LPS heptosyltransferase
MENKKNINYEKILIIELAGIGDLLLSIPALKAIRNSFPQAKICMLAAEKVRGLAADLPFIDNVYYFKMQYGGGLSKASILRHLAVLLKLRAEKFDIAVNMRTLVSDQSAKKMKFLLDLIKPQKTAGRNTEQRGSFFDISIPESQIGEKYESEYDLDTARAIGAEIVDKKIDFVVPENDIAFIERRFMSGGISKNEKIIGIHPGGMPSRCWPIQRFKTLIENISSKLNCCFVITGGRSELMLADELRKVIHAKAVSFVGQLTIKQTAALISKCDLFISNDTGPMHIAAVLKTPLIALFGPGDITRFDPRVIFQEAVVFYNKADCAPCENVDCDDMKCIKSIDVAEVEKAVFDLIKKEN